MSPQKDFYDELYATCPFAYDEATYQYFMDVFAPAGGSLLDVACGCGGLLHAAARRGVRVAGLDISSVAVDQAKRLLPQADLRVGDAEHLPWPDAYFDHVTCLGSIDRFDDPAAGVREIVRVMKSNARAMIMFQNNFAFDEILRVMRTGRETPVKKRLNRVGTREDWKDFLEQEGLVVLKVLRHDAYSPLFEGHTFKIRSLPKFFKSVLIKTVVPFDFATNFIYICARKQL